MIRVIVADDSAVVADILTAVLEQDPEIRVVGRAKNGAEAVDLVKALRPDLLLLDVCMPVMDGIQATAAIMAACPVPILVVAASVNESTNVAFKAIQAGAVDVVEKPALTLTADYARLDLIRHVKLVSRVTPVRRGRAGLPLRCTPPPESADRVVAIAASTGGPPALAHVLGALGGGFPSPILVVQHISPGFLEGFVEWLGSVVPMPVCIAERGEEPEPGRVHLAPEGCHLGLDVRGRLVISRDPPRDGHRPSGTVLFESVAEACGPYGVGVLLTGMGRDGADGLKALRDAGGRTICQDEATSVIWGMPKAGVEVGAAERVLPLEAIPAGILAALESPVPALARPGGR